MSSGPLRSLVPAPRRNLGEPLGAVATPSIPTPHPTPPPVKAAAAWAGGVFPVGSVPPSNGRARWAEALMSASSLDL